MNPGFEESRSKLQDNVAPRPTLARRVPAITPAPKKAPPIRLQRVPETTAERYKLEKACRKHAKYHGFTGSRAQSEANRLYLEAIEEASHKVREPVALKPIVQEAQAGVLQRAIPKGMRESASGLFVPAEVTA